MTEQESRLAEAIRKHKGRIPLRPEWGPYPRPYIYWPHMWPDAPPRKVEGCRLCEMGKEDEHGTLS